MELLPMDTLGKRIRKARGKVSQEVFSSQIEVSKGSLGFYERDENLPNTNVALKICSATGVSLGWLLTGTGSMYMNQEQAVPMAEPVQTEKPLASRASGNEKDNNEWKMRYNALEKKLEKVENQRDELAQENRDLWKRLDYLKSENYELRLALERKGGKEKKYKNPEESFLQYGVPSAAEQRSRED